MKIFFIIFVFLCGVSCGDKVCRKESHKISKVNKCETVWEGCDRQCSVTLDNGENRDVCNPKDNDEVTVENCK